MAAIITSRRRAARQPATFSNVTGIRASSEFANALRHAWIAAPWGLRNLVEHRFSAIPGNDFGGTSDKGTLQFRPDVPGGMVWCKPVNASTQGIMSVPNSDSASFLRSDYANNSIGVCAAVFTHNSANTIPALGTMMHYGSSTVQHLGFEYSGAIWVEDTRWLMWNTGTAISGSGGSGRPKGLGKGLGIDGHSHCMIGYGTARSGTAGYMRGVQNGNYITGGKSTTVSSTTPTDLGMFFISKPTSGKTGATDSPTRPEGIFAAFIWLDDKGDGFNTAHSDEYFQKTFSNDLDPLYDVLNFGRARTMFIVPEVANRFQMVI